MCSEWRNIDRRATGSRKAQGGSPVRSSRRMSASRRASKAGNYGAGVGRMAGGVHPSSKLADECQLCGEGWQGEALRVGSPCGAGSTISNGGLLSHSGNFRSFSAQSTRWVIAPDGLTSSEQITFSRKACTSSESFIGCMPRLTNSLLISTAFLRRASCSALVKRMLVGMSALIRFSSICMCACY